MSLREVLQLLPFLSNLNAAPLGSASAARLGYPALGLASADPNANAIGAIATLAKLITRREAKEKMSSAEARAQWAKMIITAAETVKAMQNGSASRGGPKTNGHVKNATGNGVPDAYEFEDYGPPPPPTQLAHYAKKGHLGDACKKDDDCARGAVCQSSGKGSKGKTCECRPPFSSSNGRCVLSTPSRGA